MNNNTTKIIIAVITLISSITVAYFQLHKTDPNKNSQNTTTEKKQTQNVICGVVQDIEGNAIPSAQVFIEGKNEQDITGTTGQFNIVLKDISDDHVRVHVEAVGYRPNIEDRQINQPFEVRLLKTQLK